MQADPIAAIPSGELKLLGQLATKSASAIRSSRFSVGCETLDRDMWDFDKASPHIAALGAKWARLQTGWGKCEKVKGVYDFAWLDSVVDRLLTAGVQPWFNVGYGNRLYLPDAPHQTAVGWTPIGDTAAREGWSAYVAALAEHFCGRVTEYEVWNEPDIKAFWTPYDPSPEAYTELVALTARAIRAADPDSKIIGGAVCCGLHQVGFDFIKRCFESGMGEQIDALTYHLYVPTPDGFYERQLPLLRTLVDAYRPGLPLWQGESGAPSKAQAGQALAEYEWDEAKQAKWFARRSVIDLALNTPRVALFHAADFEFYIVKNELIRKPYFFGLVGGPDYRPKPAFFAAQTLCTLFAGEVCRDEAIRVEGARQAYAFQTSYGSLVAYWEPQDMMQPYAPRRIPLTVRLLQSRAIREPVLIDPVSQRVYAISGVQSVEGGFRLNVPLTDWPLIIADRRAIPLTGGDTAR